MGRAPCCEKNGLKKGPWTPEEDQKLTDYIQKHGYGNWRTLPKNAGLQRCGKSCRLRWTNYLRPDIKRGRFSFEEEEAIIQLHCILGNKWSSIAARLPGRTDNEIKNYWNTHIRKRLLRMGIDPVTHSPRLDLLDLSSILSSSLYNSSQLNLSRFLGVQPPPPPPPLNQELLSLATSLISHRQNQNFLLQNDQENQLCNPQIQNNFTQLEQIQEIPQILEPNFGPQNSEWQSHGIPCNVAELYVPVTNYDCYGSNLQSNNGNQSFSFPSVLSTASSNSNTTYISTEDERESYCSDMLKFELQGILDVNELIM